MGFDGKTIDDLTETEKRKILLSSGIVLDIFGGLFLLIGLLSLVGGAKSYSLVFFIPSLILFFFGFNKLIWKEEKKHNYIVYKLMKRALKAQKHQGVVLSKDETDRKRFEIDPIFHEKVMTKVYKKERAEYNTRIRQLEENKQKLEKERISEIKRIANARWESICNGKLMYNMTEGIVRINQSVIPFSSIKGSSLKSENSYRLVTHQSGKTKKNISLGGAVAGGLLLGPLGVAAGGIGLGKSRTNSISTTNSVPICDHLGVMVNIDGFLSEIVLISGQVDQSSIGYTNAQRNAQEIITRLHSLSQISIPKMFVKPEKEPSVLDYDRKIVTLVNALEIAKADVPKNEIPEKYLPRPNGEVDEQ
jgi:hypothetical protein